MRGTTDSYTLTDGATRWRFRHDLTARDGSRSRVSRGGFDTRRKAEAALRESMTAADRGLRVTDARTTVGDYLAGWLDRRARVTGTKALRATTLADYRQGVARITAQVGHVPLGDLDAYRLDDAYAAMAEGGSRDGGPLAPKTVAKAHGVLRMALAEAVKRHVLATNVADHAEVPSGRRRDPDDLQHWSGPEARAFVDHLRESGDRWAAMWTTFVLTGMRRGEVLGLRWEHVDLDGGTIAVRVQRTIAAGAVVESRPKTDRGRRDLAIPPVLVEVLRSHRAAQAAERLAAGPAWADDGHVFTWQDGRPLHPQDPTRWLPGLCEAAGVPALSPHGLRHTFATLALAGEHNASGAVVREPVPVHLVSAALGHADPSVTLNVYAHVLPTDTGRAGAAVAVALGVA